MSTAIVNTPDIPAPKVEAEVQENCELKLDRKVAMVALYPETREQFELENPGVGVAARLAEREKWVGYYASLPAVQDAALSATLRGGLAKATNVLMDKLQDDACSPAVARDISETLLKIATHHDKQGESQGSGRHLGVSRCMTVSFKGAKITTEEGETHIPVWEKTTESGVLEAIRAMRCTTMQEAEQVIGALNSSAAVLNWKSV